MKVSDDTLMWIFRFIMLIGLIIAGLSGGEQSKPLCAILTMGLVCSFMYSFFKGI